MVSGPMGMERSMATTENADEDDGKDIEGYKLVAESKRPNRTS